MIVVNDASPEPDLARYLRELAARHAISADGPAVGERSRRGAQPGVRAASRPRQVVAAVRRRGRRRLARPARARTPARAASASSARSPTASASRPIRCRSADNALPAGYDGRGARRAVRARERRPGASTLPVVARPVPVLPPRLPRRRRRASTPTPLGGDYGVEIDFCLRAGSAGFRHLARRRRLRRPRGRTRRSARERARWRRTRRARARQALSRRIRRSEATSARARSRAAVRAARRPRCGSPTRPRHVVVFVSHPWGGGIRRYMNDLAALAARSRATCCYLEPAGRRHGEAVTGRAPARASPRISRCRPTCRCWPTRCARSASRACISITSTGCRARSSSCPAAVGVPYDCTLHDYYRDLPAVPSGDRGRPLLRRARRRRVRRLPRAAARRNGGSTSPRGAARSRAAARRRARDRAVAGRRDAHRAATSPSSPIDVWPHPEARRARCRADRARRRCSATCRRRRACTSSPPAPRRAGARPAADVSRARLDHRADPAGARRAAVDLRPVRRRRAAAAASPPSSRTCCCSPRRCPETYAYTLSVALAVGTADRRRRRSARFPSGSPAVPRADDGAVGRAARASGTTRCSRPPARAAPAPTTRHGRCAYGDA